MHRSEFDTIHQPLPGKLSPAGRSLASWSRRRIVAAADGGAVAEVALTLPLILLVMTGIFSFSIALYQKMQLVEAVGVGGAFLAVDRGDSDPCSATAAKVAAAAPGLTASSISLTFILNGVSTTGTGSSSTCPGASGQANPNLISGDSAQIQALYPCSITIYGFTIPNCQLGTQITEIVQ